MRMLEYDGRLVGAWWVYGRVFAVCAALLDLELGIVFAVVCVVSPCCLFR